MSKIEKTDSLASLLERFWEYKAYGVIAMSFISSFFAPLISILGLPATIIIVTGLGSSSLLVLLLLWKEFNQKKEIKKEEEKSNIELNQKREEKIDGILIEATNSNPTDKIKLYSQVVMLARDLPEIKKQRTEEISKRICGDNATQEQKSVIYTLLEKYEPFRDKINKLLATKVVEAIKEGSISKQSIEFLSSITDKDLEIIKEQFRYVLQLPHKDISSERSSDDLAIWYFENNNLKVQDLLIQADNLIHLESYHIKYYGEIWLGEGVRASYCTVQDSEKVITNIDSKDLYNLRISTKEKPKAGMVVNQINTQIKFQAYVCLGEIGSEIFSLLKDELKETPIEYINNLVEFWSKNNQNLNFELIENQKLITK